MIALFDTNIVVDALNGVVNADTEYQRYDKVLISRITWMEVLVGEKGDDTKLRDFLKSKFEVVSIELDVSEEAVKIRRSNKIKLPDAIILATARIKNIPLVTRNTKDFKPEWEGVRVPYELSPKTKEGK